MTSDPGGRRSRSRSNRHDPRARARECVREIGLGLEPARWGCQPRSSARDEPSPGTQREPSSYKNREKIHLITESAGHMAVSTKIHHLVDGRGMPLVVVVGAGQQIRLLSWVSQAAVSRNVAALERALGVRLMQRTHPQRGTDSCRRTRGSATRAAPCPFLRTSARGDLGRGHSPDRICPVCLRPAYP